MPYLTDRTFSDRGDAEGSALAVARGLLKLRDYLIGRGPGGASAMLPNCGASIHLLCHSMGNYLLQVALKHVADNATGRRLPRLFDQILMCAPDVDDDVLEPGAEMWRLPEMARRVTVYHNDGDLALWISDNTKGNPDRLGARGPRRGSVLDDKVYVVDCGPVVRGLIEHSYYRCGRVNDDIRECIANVPPDGFLTPAAVWPGVAEGMSPHLGECPPVDEALSSGRSVLICVSSAGERMRLPVRQTIDGWAWRRCWCPSISVRSCLRRSR